VGDDLSQEMHPMKKLSIALAIVALAVSPAFAKTKQQQKSMAPQGDISKAQSEDANAYALENGAYAGPSGLTPGVYQFGVYQGWDPDPSIRFELMRVPNGQNVD
jgi:hypothetical protein